MRPWPFPADLTREDRAKRVAKSYRGLVFRIAQGQCADPAGDLHRLDQEFIDLGINWLVLERNDQLDPEEWMRAPDLAAAIDRSRKDIYNWARLGHIEQRAGPDGAPEYSVASVIAYQAKLRQRRANTQTRN